MADSARRLNTKGEEVVVGFLPGEVRAPFTLRCAALITDYLIVVFAPVFFLLLGRLFGNDGTALLNGQLNNTGWMIALLVAVANLVVLPLAAGRSAGKMLTGLRIVNVRGTPASFRRVFLRQTVGYFVSVITLGIGFFICALNSRGRALHDYMAGTIVIQAKKHTVS
ncbi:MAG TPA: RDD family protein [Pyrinomonadaceae bacterium]|jgi:uncharacterized RDD family membrane protein YckC|nr:RDD family protein [Pyrinomonadaceae bacterium]